MDQVVVQHFQQGIEENVINISATINHPLVLHLYEKKQHCKWHCMIKNIANQHS
jgi:hypothetical protein